MKKTAFAATVAALAFALSGCGDSNDASEDALADSVEMPADEAMANVPDPAEETDAAAEAATLQAEEAIEQDAQDAADAAEAAVADVEAAGDPAEPAN